MNKSMKIYSKLSFCTIFFLIVSCLSQGHKKILVSVRGAQNEPVEDAEVFIEGVLRGRSNHEGEFLLDLSFLTKSDFLLSVRKENFSFYYQNINLKTSNKNHLLKVTARISDLKNPPVEFPSVENYKPDPSSYLKTSNGKKNDQNIKKDLNENGLKTIYSIENIPKLFKVPLEESPNKQKTNENIIFVKSGDLPLKGAVVQLLYGEYNLMKSHCVTDLLGKCLLSLKNWSSSEAQLVVSKESYQTTVKKITRSSPKISGVELKKGFSFDVFVTKTKLPSVQGVSGVDVFLNDKKIGQTDTYGVFTTVLNDSKDKLYEAKLSKKGSFPFAIKKDFIPFSGYSFHYNFFESSLEKINYFILDTDLDIYSSSYDSESFALGIKDVLKQSLENTGLFEDLSFDLDTKSQQKINKLSAYYTREGWNDEPFINTISLMVRPIVDKEFFQVDFININGQVVYSVRKEYKNYFREKGIRHLVESVVNEFKSNYPLQLQIKKKSQESYVVSFPSYLKERIVKNEKIALYGTQVNINGTKRETSFVGKGRVFSLDQNTFSFKVLEQSQRSSLTGESHIVLGDFYSHKKNKYIKIEEENAMNKISPVTGALVFYENKFLGQSNENGLVFYENISFFNPNKLYLSHPDYSKNFSFKDNVVLVKRTQRHIALETFEDNVSVNVNEIFSCYTPCVLSFDIDEKIHDITLSGPQNKSKIITEMIDSSDQNWFVGGKKVSLDNTTLKNMKNLFLKEDIKKERKKIQTISNNNSLYNKYITLINDLLDENKVEPLDVFLFLSKVKDDNLCSQTLLPLINTYNKGVLAFLQGKSYEERLVFSKAEQYYRKSNKLFNNFDACYRNSDLNNTHQVNSKNIYKITLNERLWVLTKKEEFLVEAYKIWKGLDTQNNYTFNVDKLEIYQSMFKKNISILKKNEEKNNF